MKEGGPKQQGAVTESQPGSIVFRRLKLGHAGQAGDACDGFSHGLRANHQGFM